MRDIFESNEQLVKEELLALGVRDAVLPPVFVPIPFVPFEADTVIQLVVDSHYKMYITIIYKQHTSCASTLSPTETVEWPGC